MRVISGSLKGRRIASPAGIRPVSERVRKSCFDILGEVVEGAEVLDLFAGSGSLAIEAISRGAHSADLVDIDQTCLRQINQTVSRWAIAGKVRVYHRDAFSALRRFHEDNRRFGLVFLDPPYNTGLLKKSLQQLEEYDIVSPLSFVLGLCHFKEDRGFSSRLYALIRERRYGQTALVVYQRTGLTKT